MSVRFGIGCLSAVLLTTIAVSPARADCDDLVAAFDRAVAAKSIDGAQHAAADVADDIVCGSRADEFQGKLVAFLVSAAADAATPAAERKRAISIAEASLENTLLWRPGALLGDYYMRTGEKQKALRWYEESISFMGRNPDVKTQATAAELQALFTKAAAAKALANDDQEGKRPVAWVAGHREIDGKLGGIYSQVLANRGVEVVHVPLPINFFFNEARVTPAGEQALRELAAAVIEQQVRSMKLVGHTDPRGSDRRNLELSKQRVEFVRGKLKSQGVKADITLEWKGAQQPIDTSVLPYVPNQEEVWALDRRVEWVRQGADN